MFIINFAYPASLSNVLWMFTLTIALGLGACSGAQKSDQHKNASAKSEKPEKEKQSYSPENDLIFMTKKRGTKEQNVVKGFVKNYSTEVTYFNIHVNVEFYDEENVLIKSEPVKLDESVEPQKIQKIRLEMDFPEGTDIYRLSLISADGAEE